MAESVEAVKASEEKVEKAAKTTKRKPAAKKTAAKRKPAAKKKAATSRKKAESKQDLSGRAKEAGREAFLATLGFYGKAFDQVQEQFESLQDRVEERREKASKQYKDMVKHGEKVESKIKDRIEKLELPEIDLDGLTDRAKLEEQLEKVKARFEELKETVGLKTAA